MKVDHIERKILSALSVSGGWTSGQIALALGHTNARKHGAIIRCRLIEMEQRGLVDRIDDQKPTAWRRTTAGTVALSNAADTSDVRQ